MKKLTADDIAVCLHLGIEPEDYLQQLQQDAEVAELADSEITNPIDIALMMGMEYQLEEN